MSKNRELELAKSFVNNTNRSIFLTGKAGTGKTTFLHNLKKNSLKRMVVVAPTGVAAINAKGVTIHSFFQMPFGPILPNENINSSVSFNRKFSKTKINIIKSMDLLVIDEISMVRADLLDGIDKTLRRFRAQNKVFGGVQVLMIGDLQQLSPVIKDNEWELLKPFYANSFFFSSHAFQQCHAVTIELKHIYRQDNPVFIDILNQIRNNKLTETGAIALNKQYIPNFSAKPDDGYISLTTHNNKAEATNTKELEKLKSKPVVYKAVIDGKFPEFSFPNKQYLELKVGAQVMFVKNDSDPEKRYYNGKIGKVILLNSDEVVVHCADDEYNINVTPEIWENINYAINPETKAITEEKIGSYTQMPLRLAWSITIHKSQGLTFEKAIIDAKGAFAHGQTYVALSRCKSLEGLVLKSKINSNQIISDKNVINFNESAKQNAPNETELKNSKKLFQLDLIAEVFDFYQFLHPLKRILDIYYKNRNIIKGPIEETFLDVKNTITSFLKISNGFNAQLKGLIDDTELPEKSKIIQDRFKKATVYFKNETEIKILKTLKSFAFTTDNQAVGEDITKNLDNFENLLIVKTYYFNGLCNGFTVKDILELRAKAIFKSKEKPKKTRKTIIQGTRNVELFEKLRILRNDLAKAEEINFHQVFTQKALYEICETLPLNKKELLKISDIGNVRFEKYGAPILKVIKAYCNEHDIDTVTDVEESNTKKQKKGDSNKHSLELFKNGKSVFEIAKERNLTPATITGHLSSFIISGEVRVNDLMPTEHYDDLIDIIPKTKFESLSDLKNKLDNKYSYEEIRIVQSVLKIPNGNEVRN